MSADVQLYEVVSKLVALSVATNTYAFMPAS